MLDLEEQVVDPATVSVPIMRGEERVGTMTVEPGRMEVARYFHRYAWCFHCRAKTRHFQVLTESVKPTYWGPTTTVKCEDCGHSDADLFPGTERDYEK